MRACAAGARRLKLVGWGLSAGCCQKSLTAKSKASQASAAVRPARHGTSRCSRERRVAARVLSASQCRERAHACWSARTGRRSHPPRLARSPLGGGFRLDRAPPRMRARLAREGRAPPARAGHPESRISCARDTAAWEAARWACMGLHGRRGIAGVHAPRVTPRKPGAACAGIARWDGRPPWTTCDPAPGGCVLRPSKSGAGYTGLASRSWPRGSAEPIL